MNINNFISQVQGLGISLNDEQLAKFKDYFEFLVSENEKYNLTSITDEDEVYEKHFFDCISLLNAENFSNKRVVDLGSGAGFPIVPMKIIDDSIKATALDATAKRMMFIDALANKLNIDVKTIVSRAEEYKGEQFDICVARGVAQLNVLLELACNLIKPKGFLVVMKGSNYRQEITDAKKAMDTLGYKIVRVQEVKLENSGMVHYNMCLQKVKSHIGKYPRNYAQIKNKPL